MATVEVQGQPFTTALQIDETDPKPATEWDIQVRCTSGGPVRQGDTVVATFWMRSANSGNALTQFVVEQGASPYTPSVGWPVSAGSAWKRVVVPFTMVQSYNSQSGPNSYDVDFFLNSAAQSIQIGGLTLLDYGQNYPLSSFSINYDGRDLNAPWRAEAARRIELYRKAPIVITVQDATGAPVPNAPIHVKMTKHGFGFGTAVDSPAILDTSTTGQQYKNTLLANFNKFVFEDELKWPPWETLDRAYTLDAYQWLAGNGLVGRGHNLVWPGPIYLPPDVQQMLTEPSQTGPLRNRVDTHITGEVSTLTGKFGEWDVLNEPYENHALMDDLGYSEMAEWFRAANEADPNAMLYVNEGHITDLGGVDQMRQDALYNTVQTILDAGGPLDGIGLESHFGDLNLTPPETLWAIFDRFAQFGKALEITEFDIDTDDEQLQADYTRDYLTAAFAHPAINGFMIWGFWEGRDWIPQAALYDSNWNPKPNAAVWRDLIYNQWWTDVVGQTDPDGVYSVSGFLGDYDIEVNGVTYPAKLNTAGTPLYLTVGNSSSTSAGALTAHFSMSAQGSTAQEGGSLNLLVPVGGSATVSFDASKTTAGAAKITTWTWKNNGAVICDNAPICSFTFPPPNSTITLTATASNGQTATATGYVVVTTPLRRATGRR
jgi:endo-1,4-beta-xylanase